MQVNDMVTSKYLKQVDVPDPVIVTIVGVKQVNMAKDDEPAEMKYAVKFREFASPMVLNTTNIQVCGKLLGGDTDDWKGREIVLYTDHNVSFGGQVVGGLRFRGQEKEPVKKEFVKSATAGADPFDDVAF